MNKESRFSSVAGNYGRMIAIRLSPGCDLVGGIIDACKKHNVKSGGIMSILGSLTQVEYRAITADPESKTGAGFSEKQTVKGPIEFLSGQGIICQQDGDMFIHLHGVMSDVNQKLFGGHIERGNCFVANTFEVIVGEGENIVLNREHDEESGVVVTIPRKA